MTICRFEQIGKIKKVVAQRDDVFSQWLTDRVYREVAFEVKRLHGFWPDREQVREAARQIETGKGAFRWGYSLVQERGVV